MIRTKTTRPVRRLEYWLIVLSVCAVSICYYGIRAAAVYGLAAVTAVLADFIFLFLRGRTYRIVDISNVANALILAMMLPATIPYSILILSTVFTVGIGTHVFGYRRDYIFPPAATGYLFALISWPKSVLNFPEAGVKLHLFNNDLPLEESVSAVLNREGVLKTGLLDLLVGAVRSPMGTGCLFLLAVGILVLLFRRQLHPWAFLGFLFGISISLFFGELSVFELMASNMILFAMLFFVSDPVLMPCKTYMAYLGAAVTGLFTGYLIAVYHIEYAPVIALLLTCPLWRGMAAAEKRFAGNSGITSRLFGNSGEEAEDEQE